MSYETKYIAGLESLVQEYAHRLARAETDVAGAAALADVARGEWVAENDRLVVENDSIKADNAKLAAELEAVRAALGDAGIKAGEGEVAAGVRLLVSKYEQARKEAARLPGYPGGQHDDAPLHPLLAAGFDPELLRAAGIDPDEVCVEVSDGEEYESRVRAGVSDGQ